MKAPLPAAPVITDCQEQAGKTVVRRPAASIMPMPDATEAEWQHRTAMRSRAVELGKQSKEYQIHCCNREGREFELVEPKTPDPTDRTVSKRSWKYLLHQWRGTLAKLYLDESHVSIISTEEWQSMGAAPTEDAGGPSTICGDSDSELASDIQVKRLDREEPEEHGVPMGWPSGRQHRSDEPHMELPIFCA